MQITFPIEMVIPRVALSLQSRNPSSLRAYRTTLQSAVRPLLPNPCTLAHEPMHITILYFLDASMQGDIDNIVKPILDAFKNVVYVDDQQVERLVVEKFEPGRIATFINPTAELQRAMAPAAGPRIYILMEKRP